MDQFGETTRDRTKGKLGLMRGDRGNAEQVEHHDLLVHALQELAIAVERVQHLAVRRQPVHRLGQVGCDAAQKFIGRQAGLVGKLAQCVGIDRRPDLLDCERLVGAPAHPGLGLLTAAGTTEGIQHLVQPVT